MRPPEPLCERLPPGPKTAAIEALTAKYAAGLASAGHHKIAAMMRADGHEASAADLLGQRFGSLTTDQRNQIIAIRRPGG